MGILNVTLGSINNTTAGVQEGFRDYACTLGTTLTVGQSYSISIRTNANANENVRVYLDLNNDGTLNPTTELIFSSNAARTHTGTISLPTGTVLNTALRLRVAADYVNAPFPTPCSTPQYSQTEDYAVTVQANAAAPVADFGADATQTCSGCVQFTDLTQNAPTGWLWNFGDNTTSTQQNPRHCYTTPGTYTVTLTATNPAGTNARTRTDYIVYDNAVPVAATCSPATTAFCCGYGITQFTLGTLTSSSQNGQAGYEDFTCGRRVQLTEGNSYALSLTTGTNPQDTRIWLDLNNDGAFTGNELLFTALNRVNPTGSVLIPGAAVKNVPLRLRVLSDFVGGAAGPCAAPQLGQVEDYTVTVRANINPPVSAFASNYVLGACQNPVQFTDQSQNAPTSWFWEFGDGATSTLQNPSHQYTAGGAFSVTLTTTNTFGTNTLTKTNSVVLMQPCVQYCTATGTTPNIWLTNVAVRRSATQDFANPSAASAGGYGNYVDKVITMYQGANTSLDMTVNGNLQHVLWAWVDWNRNGTFETSEQISSSVTASPVFTAGFTVPSTPGSVGFTRMRVMVRLSNLPTPNPCQINQNNSETEDYSVLVTQVQSTAEARTLPSLSIFPNPTTDGRLHLRLPDPAAAGAYAITVHNVLGATVLTSNVRLSPAQDAELDLSALPRGLYVVRLQDAQGQTAVRRVQRD
ncbi:GEVED domain-containing protein [Hymenobacter psychrotolerans]|uniref:Por secretion system C-terminal sorting domain-containing protein n=1 Tax=Hymenobacter psychrotolerans DSM 18569 TaxID=1121959 RepID=A0A1M6XCJ1_9BACT|nr:GEVED domain-containing protein [Hymenobacter psychrotolerans]SHL03643.1 Por secretion system C-terminal sorting domain-containing protein [Hymenobacter psychrotolerans DSM 18569]